jgi:hypothetical protein
MAITLNGTTGITSTGAYSSDGISFADDTPSNTLVTTTGGNVGLGTSSPAVPLQIYRDGSNATLLLTTATSGATATDGLSVVLETGTNDAYIIQRENANMIFRTNNTERMRLDSSGGLLVGTSNSDPTAGRGFIVGSTGATYSTITSGNTYLMYSNGAYRFYVTSGGGIANYSGSNVNLSDETTKTNIELSGSYLEKICAIPVKLFNYKDEAEGEQRTLGVIAQEVEAVAPEFVTNEGWEGAEGENGTPLKAIYTTDMMFGMMKAIQEQQAIITDLKSRIEALEQA